MRFFLKLEKMGEDGIREEELLKSFTERRVSRYLCYFLSTEIEINNQLYFNFLKKNYIPKKKRN